MRRVLLTEDDSAGTPLSKTVKVMGKLVPIRALVFRAQGAIPTDANWYAEDPEASFSHSVQAR